MLIMNALTKKLLEEVETWPPEDQESSRNTHVKSADAGPASIT
jgi:hypothetical protein